MLCQKDLSGTYIEHKIEEVLSLGHEATQAYKMKNKSDLSAIERFTPELQNHIKTELAPFCQFFDYFITDEDSEGSAYRYFDPPEGWKRDEDLGYFKEVNQKSIDWVDSTTLEERAEKHQIRYDKQNVPRISMWRGQVRVKDP